MIWVPQYLFQGAEILAVAYYWSSKEFLYRLAVYAHQ
jgi:hypothetical protein